MTVEFPNFSNSEVTETFIFKDSRPQERRYEEGKTVPLILDDDPKKGPSVKISGGKTKGSNGMSFVLFLLFGGALYGTYFIYTTLESKLGGDWGAIDTLPIFDGFAIMGASFVFSSFMMLFVFKLIGRVSGGSNKGDDNRLKLQGVAVNARITDVEQTNTRINDNPLIRFYYEFEDEFGTTHKGQDKMVVPMIDIGGVKDITERRVIYEKGNPSRNRMLEAMKMTMVTGCTRLIFLFVSMIFTVILMSMFLGGILDW